MLTCTMYAKIVHGDDQGRFIESVKCKTTRFPTQKNQLNGKMFQKHTEKYRNVTFAMNMLAIYKIQFTTSRDIHFGTSELICDKIKRTYVTSIRQLVKAYKVRGFRVTNILEDGG